MLISFLAVLFRNMQVESKNICFAQKIFIATSWKRGLTTMKRNFHIRSLRNNSYLKNPLQLAFSNENVFISHQRSNLRNKKLIYQCKKLKFTKQRMIVILRIKSHYDISKSYFLVWKSREFLLLFKNPVRSKHIILISMSQPQTNNFHDENRRSYKYIDYETRIQLIKMVEEQKMLVSAAAKQLQIKLSTAKVILSTYKKQGKIFQRKEDRIRREIVNQEMQRKINQQIWQPPTFYFVPQYGYSQILPMFFGMNFQINTTQQNTD